MRLNFSLKKKKRLVVEIEKNIWVPCLQFCKQNSLCMNFKLEGQIQPRTGVTGNGNKNLWKVVSKILITYVF